MRLILLVIGAFVIFGCSQESTLPSSPGSSDITLSNISSQGSDIEILPQFKIELRQAGPIKPGMVNLTATLEANVDSPSFQFQVILPDLEIARENGWTSRTRWTALSFPAAVDQRGSLGEGQSSAVPIAVDIPVPGYYRVLLVAKGEPPQLATIRSPLIQNVIEEEYWLWVDERGGAITRSMESSRFPERHLDRPGPLTLIPERVPQSRGVSPSSFTSTQFQVRYTNNDSVDAAGSPIPTPVRGALVKYTYFDQYENRIIGQGQFYTDANGNFTTGCPYGYDTYTYQVYNEDAGAAVLPGSVAWGTTLYPNDPYCQSSSNVVLTNKWSHVFANLRVIVPASQALLGYSRAKISVINASPLKYEVATDRIWLPEIAIWAPAGRFSIGHEYAHAVHEKALGGLNPNYAVNCDPHSVFTGSSYGCALSEGFADFHSVAIWGNKSAYFDQIVNLQNVSAGASVEGAVGAFFFDLVDGTTPGETSDTHDTTQYPGFYLATILKTCKYNTSNRASGIDHIVYCLEESLSSRAGHHWSDRSAVSNFSEGATRPAGWDVAAIYNNWHWNIYRH